MSVKRKVEKLNHNFVGFEFELVLYRRKKKRKKKQQKNVNRQTLKRTFAFAAIRQVDAIPP